MALHDASVLIIAVLGVLTQDVVHGDQRAAHAMFDKSSYSGNGETKYFWRSEAQTALQDSLKNQPVVGVAKNVIIFLGDGMGVSTVTGGRILKGQLQNKTGEETVLSWEKFPNVALSKTYNQDHQTPDSAGTATAYLCGVKTNMGTIGVDAQIVRGHCDTTQAAKITSILDWSLAEGKSVGVVTTTRVTHATPAGTYANTAERNWEGDSDMTHVTGGCKDIALQLIEENPDIQFVISGYPQRGNGIFDLMSSRPGYISLAKDHNPYTTLLYGNGPGAHSTRADLRNVDTTSKHYTYQSAVPLSAETHGGEDVAIFARGPMAHLLHGVREQNYIPHVMAYASCVGDYNAHSHCAASATHHSTATSNIFG
uniref:Alkaline phosphatase, tissue-nonspecific isozyme n=1 Tax=Magallana gigas TaxID=29159 RepID=A0A8W8L2U8_MAGGI